ncbi:hypothetical protein [Oceanobacillus halotolerans]|uniref:hypothetical protein n=1 Tax=Oceanobacillus halotolerans TaxID=2663380 RepID=UPI0013DCD8BF|nr:hypothetical protein [Oceanobacillus halotolerans]
MKHDYKHMYDLCKSHMHSYVLIETVDGNSVDGIITGLDDENVYMAVPLEPHEQQMAPAVGFAGRQFYGYPGYGGYPGYPGFGGYPGYGGPRRRFRRLILPLTALAALTALPWY